MGVNSIPPIKARLVLASTVILWCWVIPRVVNLSSASYRSILCIRLVLKLKIE